MNDSDRAVIVSIGSLLDASAPTAARPCGGETAIAVLPANYEDDGRLQALIAIDQTGSFDVALKAFTGDPVDVPGNYTVLPIWSDGALAGRLPIFLFVAPDMTVTESASPPVRSSGGCAPAY